tara:strand:- start:279 stop:812 length:534 start_codon:yes stop_codon:yes gene_type:complete
MSDFYKKFASIQLTLKANKSQWNDFSKYNYRSCEDILEAVKPLLDGFILTMSDEVVQVGDRIYVKSTAVLTNGEQSIGSTAFAREALVKKGMDDSQITGAASSYSRKYALNGLFCIDDNKDSDHPPVKKSNVDIAAVAKECGWTLQQVCESFDPPAKSIKDIQDLDACAAFLRSNKI